MIIYCDDYDFSPLEKCVEGEYSANCPLSAEIVIVGEEEIKRLNREFRKIDKVTDVLSFPALDGIFKKQIRAEDFPFDIENGVLSIGCIAICKEVAERQAEEYGHSTQRELFYLATHGLCHLLGYDHILDEDRAEMRETEERILKRAGLAR